MLGNCRANLVVLAAGLAVAGKICLAQGFAPQEAVRRMKVADGLRVELVAAEPLVRQPVAIDFDDRGRLWVIQYLQYPNPEGLKRVKVDRYSRTVYDQVPAPPPRGARGADRITILEDSDGDGRADKSKDFINGLNLTSGLAFGHGGVFVLNVPYLLFYPDRNRDDVPDSDPEVLLTGFGMEDAHSLANSLTWGPDGWLYGTQGSTVTSRIHGIEFQQGVWRYHPRTKDFELFCEGGGNSWGLDFDRQGNLLYGTNHGGFVMLHGVQGAYLWKSFGKHGALHNPFAFGYFDHVPHTGFRGGHVSVGGIFYRGTSFPERFREKYIAGDLLGHGIYWHSLAPRGSTFSSQHAGELLEASDAWFAPTDLALGPDGAVYVADWYDQRTAHPDPDAEWDRSNGRIYRIQAVDFKPSPLPDLHSQSSASLVERLADPNDWVVRRARRILAERRDPGVVPQLRSLATGNGNAPAAREALWALYVSGGFDDEVAAVLLRHIDAAVRSWTVRFLGDSRTVSPALSTQLAALAARDASPLVWSQLACSAKRVPAKDALPILEALLMRSDVAADPNLPLLLWWGVEQHAVAAREELAAWFASAAARDSRLIREFILPRLVRRYAAEGTADCLKSTARLLSAFPAPADRRVLFVALDEGLQQAPAGRSYVATTGTLFDRVIAKRGASPKTEPGGAPLLIPTALAAMIEDLYSAGTDDIIAIRLALRLGSSAAQSRALEAASRVQTPFDQRLTLLALLAELGSPACIEPLLALVGAGEPEPVRIAAVRGLERFADPRIPKAVLAAYGAMPPGVRYAARSLLFSRVEGTREFLDAIDRGAIAPVEVAIGELPRITRHNDAGLDALVRKHWGSVRESSPGEKLAEIRRLSNDLRAASGDASRGQVLFAKHCGTCHRLEAKGTATGPDLTHANRKDLDFLLSSLVDPSAQIRKEFLTYVVQTTDGRIFTGLIVEQTPAGVTLVDEKNMRTTIPRDRIDALQESPVSLMPENLYKAITPQELRDLFAYLQK